MTPSQLMQAMSDAGAPFEAILIAVRALEEKDAEIARREAEVAEKRAKDAERKREERALRRTVQGQSTDGPRTVQTASETPSLSPSSFPQTPNQHPHTHPEKTPARVRGSGKPQPPAKPEGVQDQTWTDFLAHRKAKGAPLTETALAGIKREAEKAGWSLEAALAEVLARGWQGFKAEFVERSQQPSRAAQGGGDGLVQSILRRKSA